MKFATIACLSGALIFSVPYALSQTAASQTSGTVTDSTGSAIPGANVSLTNEATGLTRRQTTTFAGVFVFASIPSGVYTVKVEAPGFKRYVSSNHTALVSTPLALVIWLEVGTLAETVEVVAELKRFRRRTPYWATS